MIRVKYKIEGEKPDLSKILLKIENDDFNVYEDASILYLTIVLKDENAMNELLRRLGPKNFRHTTKVTIIDKQVIPRKDIFQQKFQYNHLGYKTRVQRRGYSFFMALNKLVALGHNITKGKELYAYLAQDTLGRGMLIVYLDGDPRNNQNHMVSDSASFLEA